MQAKQPKASKTLEYEDGLDWRRVLAASMGYKTADPTAPAIPPDRAILTKYRSVVASMGRKDFLGGNLDLPIFLLCDRDFWKILLEHS